MVAELSPSTLDLAHTRCVQLGAVTKGMAPVHPRLRPRVAAVLTAGMLFCLGTFSGNGAINDGCFRSTTWICPRPLLAASGRKSVLDRCRRAPGISRSAKEMKTAKEIGFVQSKESEGVEKELAGRKLRLTSSIFGFPDFRSLIELREDGRVLFSAGMIAKEPGEWVVVNGDPSAGERDDDFYLQFSQPLTDAYRNAFNVYNEVCFWRGRIGIKVNKEKKSKVVVEGGIVISTTEDRSKMIREGTFTALVCSEAEADIVKKKGKEAFERALLAPRGENSGFKTPARLAGAERNQRRDARVLNKPDDAKKQAALRAAQMQKIREKDATKASGMDEEED